MLNIQSQISGVCVGEMIKELVCMQKNMRPILLPGYAFGFNVMRVEFLDFLPWDLENLREML